MLDDAELAAKALHVMPYRIMDAYSEFVRQVRVTQDSAARGRDVEAMLQFDNGMRAMLRALGFDADELSVPALKVADWSPYDSRPCYGCGYPQYPKHVASAPGETFRHMYRPHPSSS